MLNKNFEALYQKLLSEKTKRTSERIILVIAIASFVVHLAIIYLVDFGIIPIKQPSELLTNPIAAIYTPFSFILVYEVYLLVHYLPNSITTYIGKQYEIISLIIIRRLFKDLSNLSLSTDWFSIKYDLQFTYDIVASIALFFLIYLFYVQSKKRYSVSASLQPLGDGTTRFINIKRVLAALLVPILIALAAYSFFSWLIHTLNPADHTATSFTNINNIFFEQFFTVLIIADVILLLFSFFHTDEFHKIMRNSGFIISTILLRLSFSVTGLLNTVLIVSAIVFGLLILVIYNRFEAEIARQEQGKAFPA
ncbi:MAG: hypothetical protein EAY75_08135 [Bacteroidetes bacterium]|nr:MAG: hypothetical protein EAY75_08135 [Bacteroidota bacterium]